MKMRLLGIAAAMLFASVLAAIVGQANAGNRMLESALTCSSINRISHSDATCLRAEWDNSPHISEGYGAGSSFEAENYCSDYGEIKVHIDRRDCHDWHFIANSCRI